MDGHDLLFGLPQSEIERIKAEGVKHEDLKRMMAYGERTSLFVPKSEDYLEDQQVIELLSKGYNLKKKLIIGSNYLLVFEK